MDNHVSKLERGFNLHHVWWENRNYKSGLENEFRTFEGFVIPMNAHDHVELHRDLFPPKKPNALQMLHILGKLALWTPEDGRLTMVEKTIDEFQEMSYHDNPEMAINALKIASHLHRQLGYMQEEPKYRKENNER